MIVDDQLFVELLSRFKNEREEVVEQLLERLHASSTFSELLHMYRGEPQALLIAQAIQSIRSSSSTSLPQKTTFTAPQMPVTPKSSFRFSPKTTFPIKSTKQETSKKFVRTIWLLANKNQTEALTKNERKALHTNKMITDNVELDKCWDAEAVKNFIRSLYPNKLSNIDFQCVKFTDDIFTTFNLQSGKLIDGSFLLSNTKNIIYVRPDQDIALQKITKSPLFSAMTDEDVDEPEEVAPLSNKRGQHVDDSDDDSTYDPDNDPIFLPKKRRFTYVDPDGVSFTLEDVDPRNLPSTSTQSISAVSSKSQTMQSIIGGFKKKRTGVIRINVNRETVLEDFIRETSKGFSVLCLLKVKFLGEPGIDCGALTRECLSLLLVTLMNDEKIFTGGANKKTLALHTSSLKNETYELLGKIIQLSLFNDGPPPRFFASHLYKLLVSDSITVGIEDLQEINHYLYTTLKEFEDANVPDSNAMLRDGLFEFVRWVGTQHFVTEKNLKSDKEAIINDVVYHYLVTRIHPALIQLRAGLNANTGLLDIIRKNPDEFQNLFVHDEEHLINADQVVNLFSVNPIRDEEKIAYMYWKQYIQDVQDGKSTTTFADILAFSTGSSALPAISYTDKPCIRFIQGEYPKSNACFNILSLPVNISDYETFKVTMENSVRGCSEFLLP